MALDGEVELKNLKEENRSLQVRADFLEQERDQLKEAAAKKQVRAFEFMLNFMFQQLLAGCCPSTNINF